MVEGDFSTPLEMTGGGDVRRSDFRLAVWLVAGGIVVGDFSTVLEMTGAGKV